MLADLFRPRRRVVGFGRKMLQVRDLSALQKEAPERHAIPSPEALCLGHCICHAVVGMSALCTAGPGIAARYHTTSKPQHQSAALFQYAVPMATGSTIDFTKEKKLK